MSKTTIEKIEGIKIQIQQLENERKRLMNRQNETERKARMKRLISHFSSVIPPVYHSG